ncbi:TonB-dependent receptor [Niabella hibiscisoli]|uniref:hypothetical protein n=1 Tax=Niabella hibiscisoli TaxID=1825928 RepID=UPI001F0EDCBA|nr:hypothetical protein [Niabella hibiscisoli]MCH5718378.1 hypothetical protein [Niabella hibiscisoli]
MGDLIYRSANSYNVSLDITGGNDKTKYSISGNYNSQEGTIINSDYKRYLGKLTLDQVMSDKFKVGLSVSYIYAIQGGISTYTGFNGSNTASLMYSILGYKPFLEPANLDAATDDLTDPTITSQFNYFFNPYINQKHLYRKNHSTTLLANGYAEYAINSHLKLRSTVGVNYLSYKSLAFNDSLTVYGSRLTTIGAAGPNGSVNQGSQPTWVNENVLTYINTFNKNHNLTALVGQSQSGFRAVNYGYSGLGVTNPGLGIYGLSQTNSGTVNPIGTSAVEWTKASFLADLCIIISQGIISQVLYGAMAPRDLQRATDGDFSCFKREMEC